MKVQAFTSLTGLQGQYERIPEHVPALSVVRSFNCDRSQVVE